MGAGPGLPAPKQCRGMLHQLAQTGGVGAAAAAVAAVAVGLINNAVLLGVLRGSCRLLGLLLRRRLCMPLLRRLVRLLLLLPAGTYCLRRTAPSGAQGLLRRCRLVSIACILSHAAPHALPSDRRAGGPSCCCP